MSSETGQWVMSIIVTVVKICCQMHLRREGVHRLRTVGIFLFLQAQPNMLLIIECLHGWFLFGHSVRRNVFNDEPESIIQKLSWLLTANVSLVYPRVIFRI
jgi:hypothetical protein